MIQRIRVLVLGVLGEAETAVLNPAEEKRAITAALLIQAALMDGHFDAAEREMVESLLIGEFQATGDEAHRLIIDAEKAVHHSRQLFGFTRKAVQCLDHQECVDLVEMLWLVVFADGELHDHEANLMRRVVALLNVTDRESAMARQRALAG